MKHIERDKSDVSRENLKKAVAARVLRGNTERECMAAIRKGWKYCSKDCRYKTMVGSKGAKCRRWRMDVRSK